MSLEKIIGDYYKWKKRFPTPKELSAMVQIDEQEAMKELRAYYTRRGEAAKKDGSTLHRVVRVSLLLISLSAAIMSVYYSALWFFERLNPVLAVLSAVIMVSYGVLFPEIVQDLGLRPVSFLVAITGVVVIGFSMVSTVAGQYNQRKVNLDPLMAASELSELRKQEETILGQIADLQSQIDTANTRVGAATPGSRDDQDNLYRLGLL